ncbi:triacylglycerol lipase [Streptococcus caprae]|uniref:Triacylglycerol lipase n=1 Tax=Streptococcus caprae TaxID=1640501 RepID=A0ABV8CVX0_9STRE
MSEKYLNDTNLQIAMTEYQPNIGKIENYEVIDQFENTIGVVTQVYDNERGFLGFSSGEQVYAVVANPNQAPSEVTEVTVLFRGSTGPDKILSQPQDVWNDWVENDLVLGTRILMEDHTPIKLSDDQSTMQLQASAAALKDIMEIYPNAKINIYAHSLGSMDAQYSMADLSEEDIKRIASAHIYNGPNIYTLLTPVQQNRVDSIKGRVYNYADPKDMISMVGRDPDKGSIGSVGMVFYADSKDIDFVDQHMTYGYQLDGDGKIKLANDSQSLIYNSVLSGVVSLESKGAAYADGGFTAAEKFVLDSELAKLIGSSLAKTAQEGTEEIRTDRDTAIQKADEIYQTLTEVPWGFILSPSEVKAAYDAGGVNYQTLVGAMMETLDPKVEKAEKISQQFTELEKSISSGIETALTKDAELATQVVQLTAS